VTRTVSSIREADRDDRPPNDCAKCHERESKQFQEATTQRAGDPGESGQLPGRGGRGSPAAVSGCKQCHGGIVKVLPNGKLDPTTWPNTGIGRINGRVKGGVHGVSFAPPVQRESGPLPESCGKCRGATIRRRRSTTSPSTGSPSTRTGIV
jgi:hypothetical protein